ncbi:hypothetical protein [Arthrobacter sp. Leaf145]|uniref:hypothetical protein n=1 Tax=Paenarthrobacter nicotinovorans TaxID=29320 RepID=UPI0012E101EA
MGRGAVAAVAAVPGRDESDVSGRATVSRPGVREVGWQEPVSRDLVSRIRGF